MQMPSDSSHDNANNTHRTEEGATPGSFWESGAWIHEVIETAVDAIITINEAGLIQYMNPASQQLFGYSSDEALGQNVRLLMPSPHRQKHDEYLARYMRTGEARIIGIGREVFGRNKSGEVFPIFLSVSEVRVSGQRVFTGIVRDISAEKRAQEGQTRLLAELKERNKKITCLYSVSESIRAHESEDKILESVVALNIISAPGSGKTSLIEAALRVAGRDLRIGVVEGDPDTTLDAERIACYDVPVVQVQTSGGCHLEANLVMQAIREIDLSAIDLLFIENVGNLVCPVEFDLGETKRVAVVSTAEGQDKPIKYPKLFRTTDLVILNKVDLLPYVDFDRDKFYGYLYQLNPGVPVIELSCRSMQGVDAWVDWLKTAVAASAAV